MENEETLKNCKRCLLRDMAKADVANIEKYKGAVKQSDRVFDAVYEERLTACKQCDCLNAGTCNACGCYVELRALYKDGKCPYKKWKS